MLIGKYLFGMLTHRYHNTGITFTGSIHFSISSAYIQILIFRYDIKFLIYSKVEELMTDITEIPQSEIEEMIIDMPNILPEIVNNWKKEGLIDLEFYKTTPEHAREYGIESKNPLFIKNIFVKENERFKSIGNNIIDYIEKYAKENSHDAIFGHIPNNATFKRKTDYGKVADIDSSVTDITLIKLWLGNKDYSINKNNNDFHKTI